MGQRATFLCKIETGGFEGPPRAPGPPYQFTALEFTEPGTRVFLGPGSDSGLHGSREGGGGEKENDRVTSPASARRAPGLPSRAGAAVTAAQTPFRRLGQPPGLGLQGGHCSRPVDTRLVSTRAEDERGRWGHSAPCPLPAWPTTSCGGPGGVPLVLQQRGQTVTQRGPHSSFAT